LGEKYTKNDDKIKNMIEDVKNLNQKIEDEIKFLKSHLESISKIELNSVLGKTFKAEEPKQVDNMMTKLSKFIFGSTSAHAKGGRRKTRRNRSRRH
jgi:hypothetical protein